MTDDHMASLRELAGDLPPLPDEVWSRALDAAFDPDATVDSDLVPEMDDRPLVPDDEDLVLDDTMLDDIALDDDTELDDTALDDDTVLHEDAIDDTPHPADGDIDRDELLADPGIADDDTGPADDSGDHLDIDLERFDEPGEDLL